MDIVTSVRSILKDRANKDIPEDEFCTEDLMKGGMTQNQASRTLAILSKNTEGTRLVFTQKRMGRKVNGDLKQVSYYKLEE
jgi:hypothetical protein